MNGEQHYEQLCETAALYALGVLPDGEATQFERQLASGCALCRTAYAECAGVVEVLPLLAPPVNPPPALKERLMARIAPTAKTAAAAAGTSVGSTPVAAIVQRAEAAHWEPAPVPGVEYRPLLGQRTMLVRMQPGASYPPHPHQHMEQCYVIEGSITDAAGMTVRAGDYVCMPAGSQHTTIRTETGCLFLIAYTH